MQKIAAGNWKMHGLQQDLAELHTIANSVTLLSAPRQYLVLP